MHVATIRRYTSIAPWCLSRARRRHGSISRSLQQRDRPDSIFRILARTRAIVEMLTSGRRTPDRQSTTDADHNAQRPSCKKGHGYAPQLEQLIRRQYRRQRDATPQASRSTGARDAGACIHRGSSRWGKLRATITQPDLQRRLRCSRLLSRLLSCTLGYFYPVHSRPSPICDATICNGIARPIVANATAFLCNVP
jgi:hypothetical protein